ncbi:hypothetical protein R9X50_00598300 [Acrodontium crateriforme]|uniref:Major facilitator superfamily (MFS) profile domain-containing protein n=1 Tax=Acrodontium crateriforme TaxID=150365 RepID=A0AAQ3M941_9PEZI|nr:hypothetical protein R9X50_00598300 [Acrodontium crateriforme]
MLESEKSDLPGDSQLTEDWDHDPENPRNYSLQRRICTTIAVTLLAFVTTFAASIYSPAIDAVGAEFDLSEEVSILPLSLYNLGLAAGPLVGSPMSETLGRKPVILITSPIFALFILGAGFSQNLTLLCTCRFFAGVFAAPAVSNASATITDFTSGAYRGISMSFYYSVPTFGAALGPLVGGFVVQSKGWRWTQWTTIFFIVAFYLPVLATRETYKKKILQRRAKRMGVEGSLKTERSIFQAVGYFATTLLLRPVHMLLTEPIVSLVCLYNGFMFGLMYTYVVASAWIYQHYYGFSSTAQTLSFLGLVTGTLLAPCVLIPLDHFLYQPRLKAFRANNPANEPFPPEHRLYPAMIASFLLPASLFAFAWTTRPTIHWICPLIFQSLTMLFNLMIYAPANLFMMDAYGPLYGASAAGAAMLSRYALSCAFPLFSLTMYKALGVGWATSVLGFATLLMAPIPWVFWCKGEALRKRTRYETSF